MFDIENMNEQELNELLDAIKAKLAMLGEGKEEAQENGCEGEGEEKREEPEQEPLPENIEILVEKLEDDLDTLQGLMEKIGKRKAVIKKEAQQRKALLDKVTRMSGDKIVRKFDEEVKKTMTFERNSKEYADLWVRRLQGRLTAEERAGWETSGTYATNAIPTQVSDVFFEKMKKLAPMLNEITLLRVAGNVQFVAEGTRNAAAKHTENSAVTAAADTTVKVVLGGFEFLKVISISKAATVMSTDAFIAWLTDMLAGDIARAIDDYIINDSTNGFAHAITFTTNTNQILNTATTGYTYDNIVDLIALVPAAYDADAKFLMNKKTLYGSVAKIVDSQKRPIFVPDTVNGIGGRIMGYEVVLDDYVTKDNNAVYLGKWSDIVGNLPEDINVERSEEAGFTSNSIMYRGTAIFDSKPAKNDAIVRLVSTTA